VPPPLGERLRALFADEKLLRQHVLQFGDMKRTSTACELYVSVDQVVSVLQDLIASKAALQRDRERGTYLKAGWLASRDPSPRRYAYHFLVRHALSPLSSHHKVWHSCYLACNKHLLPLPHELPVIDTNLRRDRKSEPFQTTLQHGRILSPIAHNTISDHRRRCLSSLSNTSTSFQGYSHVSWQHLELLRR
jgi:hypothetical protein